MTAAPPPLHASPLLRGSIDLVRRHPVVSLGIGAAVVLSLVAVPTGLGAIVAPWFVCELFAVQLETRGEAAQERGRGWALAAIVVLCTVVVIALAGWIAALGFGPDVSTADRAYAPLPLPEALRRGGLVAGTLALAVAAGTPFLYAPLVLLDRGGRLGGACLESAAMVRAGGALPHYALAFCAYALSLSPALVSMIVVARTVERAATPLGALFALPILPLTIPLGLGLITHAYLTLREVLPEPHVARSRERLAPGLVAFLAANSLAPLVGLVLIAIGGWVSSVPIEGSLPESARIVLDADARDRLHVPSSTLEVIVDGPRAAIYAGDHDGVGWLPTFSHDALTHVRVATDGSDFLVELAPADGASHLVRVDRAGLRLDDSVEARLRSRAPDAILLAFIVAFAICALGTLAVLGPLGEARTKRPPDVAAARRAIWTATALVPFSLTALVAGAIALFGLPT